MGHERQDETKVQQLGTFTAVTMKNTEFWDVTPFSSC
jgi:hypothetical protein